MKAFKRTLSTVLSLVLCFNMTFATAATELGTIASGAVQAESGSTASGSDSSREALGKENQTSGEAVTVKAEAENSDSNGGTDAATGTDDKTAASQESGTASDNTDSDSNTDSNSKTEAADEADGSEDTDGTKADSDKQDSASGSDADTGSDAGSDSSSSDGNKQTSSDSSNSNVSASDKQQETASTAEADTVSGTTEASKSETETNAAAAKSETETNAAETETEAAKEAEKSAGYNEAFNKTARSDGFYINVSAGAGVFPDDSELNVKAITKKSKVEAVRKAVLSQLESEGTDTSSITVDVNVFDITIKHGEEEIQPDTANGEVTVSIRKATATELTRDVEADKATATAGELQATDNSDDNADGTHTETIGQKVKSFFKSVANLFTAKSISENKVVSPATNGDTADDTAKASNASDNAANDSTEEADISPESLGEEEIAAVSDDSEAVYNEETSSEIEHRVFHVVSDDSEESADDELTLEPIDAETLDDADGVQFNTGHFSIFASIAIRAKTNGSAKPSIEMSSEPADADGNILWTVTVSRNELPVTEYADGFRVSARLYNMASLTQTVHRYVDGSFKAEAYDESTDSWVPQEYTDLNYTGKSGSTDNAELSWKFINNTEHAVARFTFQTNVNIIGYAIRNNTEGDYNLTDVLMDPVKLTDLGGGVADSTSCGGKIQITGQQKWIDGTAKYDPTNGCVNVTVIAHSNGYKIGDYQLQQQNFTAGMGNDFNAPSDFKYYFDGKELTADKVREYVTPIELDRYNNWSITVKGFDAGDGKSLYPDKNQDHELKITYVIKLKNPDEWKQQSHSGNYLDFIPYFGYINGTTLYTFGSKTTLGLDYGNNRGAVIIEPDTGYGDNGYNKSSHTMQWKAKFNCLYDVNGTTYVPLVILDSFNELNSISDIKYTNSSGEAVDLPSDLKKYFPHSGAGYTKGQTYTGGNTNGDGTPIWLIKLNDNEKSLLGIDKSKLVYRIAVSTPVGSASEMASFAKDKCFEFTLTTQLTDAVDYLWACNSDNYGDDKRDVALQAKMYSCVHYPTTTIRSTDHLNLLTTEESRIRSKSTIINLASTDKRDADKSAYKYTDHTIGYEITYNQNRMALNNVVISFDMGKFKFNETIEPVLELKSSGYDVKLDGKELQYLSKKPDDAKVNDYRPFYTYDIKDGLKVYPADETLDNAAEHKITFTAKVSDGKVYTDASHNNKSGSVTASVSISADQIKSFDARRYCTYYTDDYMHLSELQIMEQKVNGTIADNGNVAYSLLINKNQEDIPAGVNLKLDLSKGHRFTEGSLRLYECTVSETGEVTQGAEVAASKYTASCVRNDDSTSVLTVSLPESGRDKTYILKFTCDPDVQSYESISFGIRLQCTAKFDGDDTWSKISDYKDGQMDWWERGKDPEGAADSFWYEIKAIDADNANVGVSGASFVIEDEDGNSVPATGINTQVNEDNSFKTSSAGSAVVFAKLDTSKKYYVRQVSDAAAYLADNTERVELFNQAGYPGRTFLHAYTFKQVKASWLSFSQDFSGLNGIDRAKIIEAAKANISYELKTPDGTTQTIKFSDLTEYSDSGKYHTKEGIKVKASSDWFTLEQKGGILEGYNYKLGAVTQDSYGTNKNDDMQGNIIRLHISSNGSEATVDLTNTYDYPLELRFYPEGVRPDTAVMQGAVRIFLKNQKTKESAEYSLKDFTLSSNGRYYYKKVSVKQGQYTITEVNDAITGYDVAAAYSIGSGSYTDGAEAINVSIANDRLTKSGALVSFKNTYSSADNKLSLNASDVTETSAKLNGSAKDDITAVYYTGLAEYAGYSPAALKAAYEDGKDSGIIKHAVASEKSFTLDVGGLSAKSGYTYYAAAICKGGDGSEIVIGDGTNKLASVSFTTTGKTLTYLDFSVTHYNDQYYTGDDAKHTATVEPWVKQVDDETKGKYFEIERIVYKRKSGDNYIGSYTEYVSKAGTYGVFVTTKDEKNGAEHADNVWAADLTINKAELNKSLCTVASNKAYRDAVDDLVKANSNISGYGSLSYKLYEDATLTKEASANIYDAGTYYIGAECTGGDNVNATAKPVLLGTLTITKSDYEIYLGAAKAMHYGDGNKYILDFTTDNGITPDGRYERRYKYLFSRTYDGEYTEDMNGTGEWYVKVKVFGDANHNDTLSAPKIVRYEKAKLKVSVDFVKGKAWDGKTDIADGDWGVKLERADSSIPLDITWDEDIKDLSVSAKAAWTSSAAGTKTFNITDIKLVNTNMHSNIDYADLYELDTENLYNQTYGDAKISETVLTKDDFTVTGTDNLTYEDDSTSFTATVAKADDSRYKDDFEIDYVSYKLKDTETGSYSGYYTVTQAGTYGIFVTTKDEKNGVSRAEELYLGDMTVAKRKYFDTAWLTYIHPSYGSEPEADSGFINVDKKVSGYEDIEAVLYTDAAHTQKAVRNADNQYDAGTYYATITISGGTNFELDPELVLKYKITVNKANNVIALGRPKTLYYGDDMTSCVTAEAKDKTGGFEYLFSKDINNDSSFKSWDDTDTNPCGVWYVKVKTAASTNYNECMSDAVAFELKKARLVPVISSLESKKYNAEAPDDKEASGSLSLGKVEGIAATYGKLDADIKAGLSAAGTFTWTSAEAGTNTVDVTDIKLADSYTGRYELTTDKLESQTYDNALIYADARSINATDFSWPDDRSFTYDGAAHKLDVEANGPAAKFIKDIQVSYKLCDAATGGYTGDYIDEPVQAGTYEVFVTADSTNQYYTGVENLQLTSGDAYVQLVINPAVNKISVYNVKDVYYGDDMSKVLSFILTDNTAKTSLVFSDSEEGTYKTWADIKAADEIKTGTWYVKVMAEATANHAAAESEVKSFELKAAPVTPEISNLVSRQWKKDDTSATGTLTLKAASTDVSCGELVNDLKAGLKAEGTFNWTSYKAGTDTVDVTGITLSGTHAGLYELSTKELKSKTFTGESGTTAKLTGDNQLTAADFKVSDNTYDYAGDYTSYDVTIVPTGDHADDFNVDVDKVRYKLIDLKTGQVTGDFTDDPTDAGEYAIFVTTKDEAEGLERARDLELKDRDRLVIKRVNLKDEWVFGESSISYGSKEALAEPDFIISGYGTFETKLYTAYDKADASKCIELQKDESGNYPVGTGYTLVASVTGGNNIAASSVVVSENFTVEKAENVVTLSTPKVIMYYGDEMETVVKVTAKYGADTAKLLFARSADGEFAAWDDNNTEPSGIWYVKAEIAATDSYKAAESKAVAFRVMKAPLNVVVSGLDSKTYDGTTDATGMLSLEKVEGTAASYGRFDADVQAGLSASGTFAWTSAAAGTDTVNVTDIKLTEAYAGRYELKVTHLDGVSYGGAKINEDPTPDPTPTPTPNRKSHNSSRETTGSSTGGSWVKDDKGWRYKLTDGSFVKGSSVVNTQGSMSEEILWYTVGGASYAFGEDGYLQSGWVYNAADGKWYYCDENKGKQYGWRLDSSDGYWYYLDARTGAMLTGWQLINGKWYFFAGVPGTSTWSFDAASDKWVYDNTANNRPYGSLYTNSTTPDNFRVNLDGVWVQ